MKKTKNTTYVNIPQERNVELNQFIRGSLLGDGSIAKLGEGAKNHKMTFGHGSKQQDYLKWKQDYLRSYSLAGDIITKVVSINKRYKSGECISFHFKAKSHPIFTQFYNLYYLQGKRKICRKDIVEMNEFALAIWFMDDGHVWSRKNRTACLVLNTTSFRESDVKYLMQLLYKKWKLNSSYLKTDNCIRISVESSPVLLELIKPYMVKGLEYKWVLNKEEELPES